MGGARGSRRVRQVRAFLSLPGVRGLGVAVVVFVGFFVASTWIVATRYTDPATGTDLDPVEALYTTFSLLFFSPPVAFPTDVADRVVFFALPLLGFVIFSQAVVGLTTAMLNKERWTVAQASTYSDHVIVCGVGRVGFRVIDHLLELGEDVVAISLARDPGLVDQIRGRGVPIIAADARRGDVLLDAGLPRAKAILPVTNDDVVNLSIATEARRLRPGVRVVLRTFDDRLAENLVSGFDIHRAYSTSALAAPAFAAAALDQPVDHAFWFGEGTPASALITITKFTVVEGSPLAGWSLNRLEEEFDVAVLAHRTDVFDIHPQGTAVLSVGDGFVVSASLTSLAALAELTPPTRELHGPGHAPR